MKPVKPSDESEAVALNLSSSDELIIAQFGPDALKDASNECTILGQFVIMKAKPIHYKLLAQGLDRHIRDICDMAHRFYPVTREYALEFFCSENKKEEEKTRYKMFMCRLFNNVDESKTLRLYMAPHTIEFSLDELKARKINNGVRGVSNGNLYIAPANDEFIIKSFPENYDFSSDRVNFPNKASLGILMTDIAVKITIGMCGNSKTADFYDYVKLLEDAVISISRCNKLMAERLSKRQIRDVKRKCAQQNEDVKKRCEADKLRNFENNMIFADQKAAEHVKRALVAEDFNRYKQAEIVDLKYKLDNYAVVHFKKLETERINSLCIAVVQNPVAEPGSYSVLIFRFSFKANGSKPINRCEYGVVVTANINAAILHLEASCKKKNKVNKPILVAIEYLRTTEQKVAQNVLKTIRAYISKLDDDCIYDKNADHMCTTPTNTILQFVANVRRICAEVMYSHELSLKQQAEISQLASATAKQQDELAVLPQRKQVPQVEDDTDTEADELYCMLRDKNDCQLDVCEASKEIKIKMSKYKSASAGKQLSDDEKFLKSIPNSRIKLADVVEQPIADVIAHRIRRVKLAVEKMLRTVVNSDASEHDDTANGSDVEDDVDVVNTNNSADVDTCTEELESAIARCTSLLRIITPKLQGLTVQVPRNLAMKLGNLLDE